MGKLSFYDDVVVTWSEQQVVALRTLAARPDLSNAVDWVNVIEEIECLGRNEWEGVESQICNALRHTIKGYADTASLSFGAWDVETERCLDDARTDYRPSMRQQINAQRAWERAVHDALRDLKLYNVSAPAGLPKRSPLDLEDILQSSFTYINAIECLRAHRGQTGASDDRRA